MPFRRIQKAVGPPNESDVALGDLARAGEAIVRVVDDGHQWLMFYVLTDDDVETR
jgi:hypothetical protein